MYVFLLTHAAGMHNKIVGYSFFLFNIQYTRDNVIIQIKNEYNSNSEVHLALQRWISFGYCYSFHFLWSFVAQGQKHLNRSGITARIMLHLDTSFIRQHLFYFDHQLARMCISTFIWAILWNSPRTPPIWKWLCEGDEEIQRQQNDLAICAVHKFDFYVLTFP